MDDLGALGWPIDRLGEALERIAEQSRFPLRAAAVPAPPASPALEEPEAFDRWIQAVAAWIGLEAEPVDAAYGEAAEMILDAGPALLRVPNAQAVWVLLGRRRGKVRFLAPDGSERRLPVETVRAALCEPLEAPIAAEVESWLSGIAGSSRSLQRARDAFVRERLGDARLGGCWLVRLPTGSSFWAQARADGLPRRVVVLLAAHVAYLVIGLGGWYMLGRGALEGRLESSWLVAWALLLLTTVPMASVANWQQAMVGIGVGKLLKRRVVSGALKIDPAIIRNEGSGQLLGRSLEASAIEGLALSAAFGAVLAIIEFALVMMVLSAGAGGSLHAALLALWALATLAVGWRAYKRSARWTDTRRDLTNAVVEQMTGHRTRLAQQPPYAWHDGEDEALERYHAVSREMDSSEILLGLLPQAWLVVGLLGLAPGFVAGGSMTSLAIGVGGVFMASGALGKLGSGMMQVAGAVIAWRQVAPLFHAAAKVEVQPSPTIALASERALRGTAYDVAPDSSALTSPGFARGTILDASDLVFAYEGRPEPAIKGASVRIQVGDRLLLEGPSGGGKSTLASILAGLRAPSSGLLLVDGLDFPTLGPSGWRRVVAAAPQFHDNHVLTETFAFNLLMGREWPPSATDLEEAEETCEALGLGELVRRMPGGLMQMVGESGWRLSHGERSRLFMARALLQRARLVVLDESFAALDPKTLDQCLRCVLERAPAVLVIAHP